MEAPLSGAALVSLLSSACPGAKPESNENQNPHGRYRQYSQRKRICKTARATANQRKDRWKSSGSMRSMECNGWGKYYREQKRMNEPLQEIGQATKHPHNDCDHK